MYNEVVLGREEAYEASANVWSFKQVNDIVHGVNLRLSNMAGGFPFIYHDIEWKDSERLYLCGEYSLNTPEHQRVQQELRSATSGYAAKRFFKAKYKKLVRPDFPEFRLQWMLFVVWQKCLGNSDFCHLLLQTPEEVTLVENTTTDTGGSATIWGCKNRELLKNREALKERLVADNSQLPKKELEHLLNVKLNQLDNIGTWRGQNNIGKILMLCRHALRTGTSPSIDYDLLRQHHLFIDGREIMLSRLSRCHGLLV